MSCAKADGVYLCVWGFVIGYLAKLLADALRVPSLDFLLSNAPQPISQNLQRFMESILVSSTVFAVVFGGALAGMGLRHVMPQNQLGLEAKDVIRLATGLLVTMTALVLGMLVSTANSSYQDRKNELAEMGSNFVLVDGLLASYGPDAQAIREELRGLGETGLDRVWPTNASRAQLRPKDNGQSFYDHLRNLAPKDDTQIAVKAAAISAAVNLRHTYWLMFIGTEQLPVISLIAGCGLVAEVHLHQLRSLRAGH